MNTPNNAAAAIQAAEKIINTAWQNHDEDARVILTMKEAKWLSENLATLRATVAHEASGADWHWLRTDDWSEIVQAMPLGDDRYATGYQDAMNAVTRKLCSLPRPVINPAQPDASWEPSSNDDYDRSIHSNPDASDWADFFVQTFPGQAAHRDLMLGWFANAMMAMHDHLKTKPDALTSQPSGEVLGYVSQSSVDALDKCRRDDHNGTVDLWMRPTEFATIPVYTHPSADAPGGEVDEAMVPASSLREIYAAYVRLLETGRDRIIELGGACDSVEAMERGDFDLHKARIALSTAKENGRE